MHDTAGFVSGQALTVGELDKLTGGTVRKLWREYYNIYQSAAYGVCRKRAIEFTIRQTGLELEAWNAERWLIAEPNQDELRAHVAEHPDTAWLFATRPAELAHQVRVKKYREEINRVVDAAIGGSYRFRVPPPPAAIEREPGLPEIVADCLGGTIEAPRVVRFAAAPLNRLNHRVHEAICSEFAGAGLPQLMSGQNPTSPSGRLAAGNSTPIMMPSSAEVEAAARRQYGSVDPVSLRKAREEIIRLRERDARMDVMEKTKARGRTECSLQHRAPIPLGLTRKVPGETPPKTLHLFSNFSCSDCSSTLRQALHLQRTLSTRGVIEFHHHFPEASLEPFAVALEGECAERQQRFWHWAQWRFISGGRGNMLHALGLDPIAFTRCLADPKTAVTILDDTDKALHLGLRGIVPAWVSDTAVVGGKQAKSGLRSLVKNEWNITLAADPPPPAPVAPLPTYREPRRPLDLELAPGSPLPPPVTGRIPGDAQLNRPEPGSGAIGPEGVWEVPEGVWNPGPKPDAAGAGNGSSLDTVEQVFRGGSQADPGRDFYPDPDPAGNAPEAEDDELPPWVRYQYEQETRKRLRHLEDLDAEDPENAEEIFNDPSFPDPSAMHGSPSEPSEGLDSGEWVE